MMAEFTVVQDIGSGKGMLSCVQLVHVEQSGGNVILKVPGCDFTKERLLIDDNTFSILHNTEVAAYTILQQHSEKNILHPKVFELEKMDPTVEPIKKGYIIMEYMSDITHLYCTDNLKPDELVEAVKNLARFHSLGAELTKGEGESVSRDFVKNWFTKLFTQSNKDLFNGHWKGQLTDWLTSGAAKETVGKLDGMLTPEIFEQLNNDCSISGIQEVLCHGDYSLHNLLYQKRPDGSYKFRAIVDFQEDIWGTLPLKAIKMLDPIFYFLRPHPPRRKLPWVQFPDGNVIYDKEGGSRGMRRIFATHLAEDYAIEMQLAAREYQSGISSYPALQNSTSATFPHLVNRIGR